MKATRGQKNSLLMRLCVLVFAGYAAVTLVSQQMQISAKHADLMRVEQQIEQERLRAKELERQVALGEDESYLARIARDKLDMGFSDEHVYQDVSGT